MLLVVRAGSADNLNKNCTNSCLMRRAVIVLTCGRTDLVENESKWWCEAEA